MFVSNTLEETVQPRVGIVILNWNGWEDTIECLESVYETDYTQFFVIVVDNGSHNNSVIQIEAWATDKKIEYQLLSEVPTNLISFSKRKLVLLKLPENLGFSKANNVGAKISDSEYVVFLNNDTTVDKFWLKELVLRLKNDENVAGCSSKLLFYSQRHMLNYAGAQLSLLGKGYELGFNQPDSNSKSANSCSITGALCGGAMIIRKKTFLSLDGFDEDYFAYHEDSDMSWRLWIYGYTLEYVPTSIVYHKFRGSWNKKSSQRVMYGVHNRLSNIIKNLGTSNMFLGLTLHTFYSIGEIIQFLLLKQPIVIGSLLKGTSAFLKNLKSIMKKRKIVQSRRVVSDEHLIKQHVLLGFNSVFRFIVASLKTATQNEPLPAQTA